MGKNINRRDFLKLFGMGSIASAAVLAGCKGGKKHSVEDEYKSQVNPPKGKMTCRLNPKQGDKVSLLGYGMMRLPATTGKAMREKGMK